MNHALMQKMYNGFKLDDTLASRLTFSGIITVNSNERVLKPRPDGDIEYWTIKDDHGARFSTFDKNLAKKLVIFGKFAVKGEIKIGKGGTFLNIKDAEEMNGSEFSEEK